MTTIVIGFFVNMVGLFFLSEWLMPTKNYTIPTASEILWLGMTLVMAGISMWVWYLGNCIRERTK